MSKQLLVRARCLDRSCGWEGDVDLAATGKVVPFSKANWCPQCESGILEGVPAVPATPPPRAVSPANKLRELLATRPVCPGLVELVRWWLTSAELVPQVLDQLENDTCARHAGKAHGAEAEELRRGVERILQNGYGSTQAMYQALQRMLDEVSAHDSLAYLEDRDAAVDVLKQEARELEQQRDAHRASLNRIADRLRVVHENDKIERAVEALRTEREADAQAFFDLKSDYGRACNERDLLRGQLEAARVAAQALVTQVEHLAAFADDGDPRVMATAGPLGAAQADLWLALGLDLDAEHARMQADIESRCAVCGWPLAERMTAGVDVQKNGPVAEVVGCVRGSCSMRPRPEKLYAPDRAKREAEELHERALRNGMPPSGRWA